MLTSRFDTVNATSIWPSEYAKKRKKTKLKEFFIKIIVKKYILFLIQESRFLRILLHCSTGSFLKPIRQINGEN